MFSSYWISRSILQAIGTTISYLSLKKNADIDWIEEIKKIEKLDDIINQKLKEINKKLENKPKIVSEIFARLEKNKKSLSLILKLFRFLRLVKKSDYKELKNLLQKKEMVENLNGDLPNYKDIIHIVMLADYKEGEKIIRPSIEAIKESNYPKDKIIVVLANEERSREITKEYAERLKREYKNTFFEFLNTVHPDLPNEVKAKGANFLFASKEVKKFLDERNIDYKNVLISAFDGDTRPHKEYFGKLTHDYILSKNRLKKSFQPNPLYFNNIWDTTWFCRAISFGTSFWSMTRSGLFDEFLFTYSGHSTSFESALKNGLWSADCINEDSKQGFKAFLNEKGEHKVIPLSIPIFMDSVFSGSLKDTIKNQYKQLQRWAYGAEHIPYMLTRFFKEKDLQTRKIFFRIMSYLLDNVFWASSTFSIMITSWIPTIISKNISNTAFGFNYYRYIFLGMWIFGFISLFGNFIFSILLSKKFIKNLKIKPLQILYSAILQWLFYPVILFVFYGTTGLDSMTRLMLGKYLTYWTTVKKVKEENKLNQPVNY